MHLTVAPLEGRTNTLEIPVLRERTYLLTCLTMLFPDIYVKFLLDSFLCVLHFDYFDYFCQHLRNIKQMFLNK